MVYYISPLLVQPHDVGLTLPGTRYLVNVSRSQSQCRTLSRLSPYCCTPYRIDSLDIARGSLALVSSAGERDDVRKRAVVEGRAQVRVARALLLLQLLGRRALAVRSQVRRRAEQPRGQRAKLRSQTAGEIPAQKKEFPPK